MDLGLDRTPKCTGPKSGPLRVRIEARKRWMASTKVSSTWSVWKILRTGRHVGLDFYDLLIEALIERVVSAEDLSSTRPRQSARERRDRCPQLPPPPAISGSDLQAEPAPSEYPACGR